MGRKRQTNTQNNGDSTTKPVVTKAKGKGKKSKEKTLPTYSGNYFARFLAYLFEKDDASYLAIFRILWGSIMAYECYTYMLHDFNKMYGSFYNSLYQFKYYGFEWCVVPENPDVMKLLIVIQFVLGIFITIGFFYRTSSLLFFLLFSYMYLLEQAMYLNHFYLVCVLSLMMVILPCNCLFSLDAYLWPKRVYSPTCPKWCLLFVKAELSVVYTYAGVCKVNEDWLRGEPLRNWLSGRESTPYIGWLLVRESAAYFMSYGGMIYDLIIAWLLLYRPTLPLAIVLTMFFHTANKIVFNIGIFPWMMMASTTFFFTPDWPRRVYHFLTDKRNTFVPIPTRSFKQTPPRKLSILEWVVVIGLLIFLLHQILIPLRLHTYPGTVGWNEYGHQFSWRMKLRTKKCDAAAMAYMPDLHVAYNFPLEQFFNRRQYKKMASRPDMIIQAAHFMSHVFDQNGRSYNATTPTEIYIESWCELNGRPYQPFTNSTVNLAAEPKWDSPYHWVYDILPLTEEEKKNYPWNFDWNFNWLKGIDHLPHIPRSDYEARAKKMKTAAYQKWSKWMKEKDPLVKVTDMPIWED